jgi:hypothetical protein
MVWPDLPLETRFQRAVSLLTKKRREILLHAALTTAEKRFGALGLGNSRPNAYHDDDLHPLRGVAELLAPGVGKRDDAGRVSRGERTAGDAA